MCSAMSTSLLCVCVSPAGNFMPGGENGTIMKKSGEKERNALRRLMDDSLRNYVPEFKREVEHNGEGCYFVCLFFLSLCVCVCVCARYVGLLKPSTSFLVSKACIFKLPFYFLCATLSSFIKYILDFHGEGGGG